MLFASSGSEGTGTYQASPGLTANDIPTISAALASMFVVSVSKQILIDFESFPMSAALFSGVSVR